MKIGIAYDDRAIRQALGNLIAAAADPRPVMMQIGETLAETTKQRFDTATGPNGVPWAPNSEVTLLRFLQSRKGFLSKKQTATGGRTLTQKGVKALVSKKPLTGETKSLRTTINWQLVGADAVEIGSPMKYARVQQEGAHMGEFGRYSQISRRNKFAATDFRRYAGTVQGFPIPWGDIPARPFLGVSDDDAEEVVAIVADYLRGAVGGT